MPLSLRDGRAPATTEFNRMAPCDPPNTSRTGASADRPKWARASLRRAARSSVEIECRSGSAIGLAPGIASGNDE